MDNKIFAASSHAKILKKDTSQVNQLIKAMIVLNTPE
jgi:hypothetical protein